MNEVESYPDTSSISSFIAAGGYTKESAEEILKSDEADLVAFGKPFIANPDLVERFQSALPLRAPDPATLFQGGAEGYITYRPSDKELVP